MVKLKWRWSYSIPALIVALRCLWLAFLVSHTAGVNSHVRKTLTHRPLDKMVATFADDIFKYIFVNEQFFLFWLIFI